MRSKIQVPLQVGRVHHVDDEIRRFFNDVFAHIQFLGRISRERVSARKVDDAEVIALKVEVTFFGIYGYPAVIAHPLMRPRSDIEKRCLAAVRITHQCHVDGAPFAQCQSFEFFVAHRQVFGQTAMKVGLQFRLFGFLLAHHLNHGSFLSAQGYFISHHLVFYRVFERRIKQYLHGFAFDKSHLYNALAESSMPKHLYDDPFFTGLQF